MSVKLCASDGIEPIAMGVVKCGADVINIAGYSGGTGAAVIDSIKQTGSPSNIALYNIHSMLVEAGLRHKVRLRVSESITTPKDMVTLLCLGADEFEIGTAALMLMGCNMLRKCNETGKCTPGITNNERGFEGDFMVVS